MATPIQQNLHDQNTQYANTFDQGHLALPPAKKYLVLTCMDARIDPAAAFGISLGDAHVIRNAGADASDALRSIVISQQLLGTREILLVKHTGCGMLTFTNEQAHGLAEENLVGDVASAAAAAADGDQNTVDIGLKVRQALTSELADFRPFPQLEESVRGDVKWLNEHVLVTSGIPISGWVYEVETGKVRRVV
ncbi:carbonic anhydraes family protein [Histoplasma capsulatum var. duboisii H88]|uniref:Carbonic anhydrase n=1 Tax=Ajellomyces capsulatus (strain H88) TaxID=544711 RepID=F0UI90_AJEC8|nr:carbonic anhydraes family protein [Histoplasma capsulatum var. duboisii H88]QSS56202.1 carbonic anhydrase [Histoplasma capsulatum var. duboisii H88]